MKMEYCGYEKRNPPANTERSRRGSARPANQPTNQPAPHIARLHTRICPDLPAWPLKPAKISMCTQRARPSYLTPPHPRLLTPPPDTRAIHILFTHSHIFLLPFHLLHPWLPLLTHIHTHIFINITHIPPLTWMFLFSPLPPPLHTLTHFKISPSHYYSTNTLPPLHLSSSSTSLYTHTFST